MIGLRTLAACALPTPLGRTAGGARPPCHRLLLMLLLCVSGTAVANKTDVVEFAGSRLVGEAKQLDRGKLSFKTDSTGTIEIDWTDVTRLETTNRMRLEKSDGLVLVAAFRSGAKPGTITLDTDDGEKDIPIASVVGFEPLKSTFWDQLDIDTSLGYSFTQSNGVEQLNFSASAGYASAKRDRTLSFSTQSSSSTDEDKSVRNSATYQSLRLFETTYFTGWNTSYEDNDALDLVYRVQAAWVGGRQFFPVANRRWRLAAGLALNRERYVGSDAQVNTELVLGGTLDWFKFHSPELDLSSNLTVYPSLSDWGRVRANIDVSLRWEIWNDLYWQLSLYDDYDSNPDITGDSSVRNNDYGITTSLGWSW